MISDNDSESRIERYQLAVALLLGGLVTNAADVLITLQAWVVESNSLVLSLGPGRWIAVKSVLLGGLVACWWVAREHRAAPVVLVGPLLVGLFGLVGNASASGWHATEIGRGALAAAAVSLLVVVIGAVGLERLRELVATAPRPPIPSRQTAVPAAMAVLMATSVFAGVVVITQPVAESQSGTASAAPGDKIWEVSTGDMVKSSPTIYNETVYVGDNGGDLYAYDEDTGSEDWTTTFGGAIKGSPTVYNDTLYVTTLNNYLYALDPQTGSEKWSYQAGGSVEGSPTVKDGTVYFGSDDNFTYAVNADTGSLKWKFETGNGIRSSPTVANDTVYIGSLDNSIYALDTADGSVRWSHATNGDIKSAPTVSNGTVYIGSKDDSLYALDVDTGSVEWSYATSGAIDSSPTVADGKVFVGSNDGSLYSINTDSGSLDWSYATGADVRGSPTYAGGNVYVGSRSGDVSAVNASSGSAEWTYSMDYYSFTPTVAGGKVFIGSAGDLYSASEGGYTFHAFDTNHLKNSSGSRNNLHTLGHVGAVGFGQTGAAGNLVNGTVTDPTGDAYGGATVELLNSTGAEIGNDTSAGNGSYSISGVSDGDYTLKVKSDDYDTETRSVTVNGSAVTTDVRLGYQQTIELNDPRELFAPYDPVVTVYRWDKVDVPTSSPSTGDGWTETQSKTVSWDGDVKLGMSNGEFYALELVVDHSAAANGSAEATIFGFVGNSSRGAVTWDVSEPEGDSDEQVVATVNDDTARVVYDGPPVEALNYSVRDGNETLERNLSFDEPRSYFDGQVQLGNTGDNISDPESVSYSGVYENGSTFSGSSQFSTGNFSASFGPVSGGGGNGPPVSPLIATTGVAAVGVLLYSRSSGRSLGELASGAADAVRGVTGRGR